MMLSDTLGRADPVPWLLASAEPAAAQIAAVDVTTLASSKGGAGAPQPPTIA